MSYGKMIVLNALGGGLWGVLCDRLGLPDVLLYGGLCVIMAASAFFLVSSNAAVDRAIEKLEAEDRRNQQCL